MDQQDMHIQPVQHSNCNNDNKPFWPILHSSSTWWALVAQYEDNKQQESQELRRKYFENFE